MLQIDKKLLSSYFSKNAKKKGVFENFVNDLFKLKW